MNDFSTWIAEELDRRNLSRSEAARKGGISPSAIDKIIGGFANPGIEFCRGIARAFNMPLEEVFRVAGILPPSQAKDPAVGALLARLNAMSPGDRRDAVTLASLVVDFFENRTAELGAGRVARGRPSAKRSAVEPNSEKTRADRLDQFRALLGTLTDEERQRFFEELKRPDERETQVGDATL
jgi:transcriptional regulator with XRE-family HTH domain